MHRHAWKTQAAMHATPASIFPLHLRRCGWRWIQKCRCREYDPTTSRSPHAPPGRCSASADLHAADAQGLLLQLARRHALDEFDRHRVDAMPFVRVAVLLAEEDVSEVACRPQRRVRSEHRRPRDGSRPLHMAIHRRYATRGSGGAPRVAPIIDQRSSRRDGARASAAAARAHLRSCST